MDEEELQGIGQIDDTTGLYRFTRNCILGVVVFGFFFAYSYWRNERLRRKSPISVAQNDADVVEDVHSNLPLFLASFVSSVSLTTVSLLLFTIVAKELSIEHPRSIQSLLHTDTIFGMWVAIFWISNGSLLLVGFGFFYCEAEGFFGSRGVAGRFFETSVILMLVVMFLSGYFYLAQSVWEVKSEAYVPFSVSFVSSFGAMLYLVTTPLGLTKLISNSFALRTPLKLWKSKQEDVRVLKLEKETLERRLLVTRTPGARRDSMEMSRELLQRDLNDVTARLQLESRVLLHSPVLRNFVCVFLLAGSVFLSLNVVLRVLFKQWYSAVVPTMSKGLFTVLFLGMMTPNVSRTRAAIELVLSTYFAAASYIGVYEIPRYIPYFRAVLLVKDDTPMQVIVFNSGVWLVMSASLPMVAGVLGMTTFDLMGHYHQQWSETATTVYNVVFLAFTALPLFRVLKNVRRAW